MSIERNIVIMGASARAAAFSALRAGLTPWCADLFADSDLIDCVANAIPFDKYPHGFLKVARQAPPGPWMFTGGLENRPGLIERISRERPLWGCPPEAIRMVRDPANLARIFARFDIPFPEVRFTKPQNTDRPRWLAKPKQGAGGSGIAEFQHGDPSNKRNYYQEFIEGISASAVYVGRPDGATLFGVTRQLVGEPWLNAKRFQYCGSVTFDRPPEPGFDAIGDVLARECALRGLFGVDCIIRDGVPWPVEVNPRYTASVEVIEWASGRSALIEHANVFCREPLPTREVRPLGQPFGKAILFARRTFEFPASGPWDERGSDPPRFADIPKAGTRIEMGWPVLSLFARAGTMGECVGRLREMATEVEKQLETGLADCQQAKQ